jgi:hypothetical protein
MLDLQHQYNNCTTIPHMRVGPTYVLVLYKNQIPRIFDLIKRHLQKSGVEVGGTWDKHRNFVAARWRFYGRVLSTNG